MTNLHYEGFTQNREISWLRFNERVLLEGNDRTVPLLERLNFVSIFITNLDEFFMIRAGSLLDLRRNDSADIDERSGMTPGEQLRAIYGAVPVLYREKDAVLSAIENEMRAEGLIQVRADEMSEAERREAEKFYRLVLEPVISPEIMTPGEDFPFMRNGDEYFLGRMDTESGIKYAFMPVPETPHRLLFFTHEDGGRQSIRYIRADEILMSMADEIFAPFSISEHMLLVLTRSAEVDDPRDDEKENGDIRKKVKTLVDRRRISEVDHVNVMGRLSEETASFLCEGLKIRRQQIFSTNTGLSLRYIDDIRAVMPDEMKRRFCYQPFSACDQTEIYGNDIMTALKRGDILSSYPYDSMRAFVRLLEQAACDDAVSEIRITIYRLADHAEIAEQLMRAARNGKTVRVIIELLARFDEENNIDWSKRLEDAGCRVYYGSGKYKVHSKLCQILRSEGGETVYVTQVGTGNYNEATAGVYTDFSLMTRNQELGRDISAYFEDMAAGRACGRYRYILAAPFEMRDRFIELADREIKKGRRGRIFIKVNSVTDGRIMEKLSEASCAGVKIRMIVRGICCLLPHVEFCTENIDIVNVVGRFLEHSRVYVFGSGNDEVMYISSADLMTRNMSRRFELACPVYDSGIRQQIKQIMYLNYHDDVKGRRLCSDGCYEKKSDHGTVDSQKLLCMEKEEE